MTPPAPAVWLSDEQRAYLRWLAAERRYAGESPDGAPAGTFRTLVKLGLATYGSDDTGVHSRHTQELTPAGRQAALSEDSR